MPLSARQKKYLRGLSHALNPVVTVAEKGLTENVMAEIELALDHHELIKVKLRGDRDARASWTAEIGQVSCFYRRNPDRTVVEIPKA